MLKCVAEYRGGLFGVDSLLVFSEDKSLAQNIDDKKWLFSENDLKRPNSAPIFKKLLTMSSDIQNLTKHLIDYCNATDATKLQPLENIIGTSSWSKTFSKKTPSANNQTKDTTSDWNTFSKSKTTSNNNTDNWNVFPKSETSLSNWGNTFSKYCNQCGKEYKPTSNFCSYCGKKRK